MFLSIFFGARDRYHIMQNYKPNPNFSCTLHSLVFIGSLC